MFWVHGLLCITFVLTVTGCSLQPEHSGTRDVRIVRDNFGTPHIYADTVYGLYYGYGYSVAQDRLFQMEMARRSTQGTVAEVLGLEYLEFDKNARQIYSPTSIRRQLALLRGDERDVFDAYAAGLNAWLAAIRQNPDELTPKQFLEFGFSPQRWTAYDVAMIFVGTMANRYGDFNTEPENLRLLSYLREKHGAENAGKIFDSLNPRYSDDAPTTIPRENWSSPVPDVLSQRASSQTGESLSDYRSAAAISGMSNCFVIGTNRTHDGSAIIVNGPQFGWFNPAYTYSVGMHGAAIDVVGNTPFAYPFVMFGHNDSIAWGSTWGAGDIVDVFVEQLNIESPTEYLYKGHYRPLEHRSEIINVRGQESVTVDIYRSVHGPIVYKDDQQGIAYAKQRAWDGNELQTLVGWIHTSWAKNFDDWKKAAAMSGINVNMYYADVEGNIGYFFGGRYPQRASGHDNRFPVSGDGSMDWLGRLPIEIANPSVKNPAGGIIANWNNKPGNGVMNPDEFWYSWSGADRVEMLHDVLSSQSKFTPDDAWGIIETSSYADLYAKYFLPLINTAAAGHSDQKVVAANRVLQAWNRQSRDDDADGFYDGAATAIFRMFVDNVIEAVLADDLGDMYPMFAASGYPTKGTPTAAGTNLQTGAKTVLDVLCATADYDFLNAEPANELINRVLVTTLSKLEQAQGSDLIAWRLPVAQRPYAASNFLGIPQTSGDDTITTAIEQNRGTENNMVVLRKGRITAYEVVPPGQNAFIAPNGEKGPNSDDQLEMYNHFDKKQTWFYADEIEANKVSEITVRY